MIIFLMVRATFTIDNTSFASSMIRLVQGQADVTALPSPKRLSTFPREVAIRRKADIEERGVGYAQAGIRFFSAFVLDLGKFLWKSDALIQTY
jgi:hypothetical protein